MTKNDTESLYLADEVRLAPTPVGLGVFGVRPYPQDAVIGEITGEFIVGRHAGSSYSFEVDTETQLEPQAPFRFLNHSCDPNCEFDWLDHAPSRKLPQLLLIALRTIRAGEELTIDYNWPASCAIPCRCAAGNCRGWVVSSDELEALRASKRGARGDAPPEP